LKYERNVKRHEYKNLKWKKERKLKGRKIMKGECVGEDGRK
jgi:hypothetical protein